MRIEGVLLLMCDGSVAQCQIKEMFLTRKQLKFWEQGSRPDAENCACAIIKLGKDASHQDSRERYQTNNIIHVIFCPHPKLSTISDEPQILARNQNIKMKLQNYIATIKIIPNVNVSV